MLGVLAARAPGVPVVPLMADAPRCDPKSASYLLAPLAGEFPEDSIFICVVDPGVGSGRAPGILRAGGRWYVGPDNGLFEQVIRRAPRAAQWWEVLWRPARLSASFHGRDLFAPMAAKIATGWHPGDDGGGLVKPPAQGPGRQADWPDDLARVVYVDAFGNAVTGVRAAVLGGAAEISIGGRQLPRASTFSDVSMGAAFWYENSNGLVEIAVNQGRAADRLDLAVGSAVSIGGL